MQAATNSGICNNLELDPDSSVKLNPTDDYADILKAYALKYKRTDYYLEVGEMPWDWGWILDISVIHSQVFSLLEVVIPVLIKENVFFKIPRSSRKAHSIIHGELGWLILGKVICLYPRDIESASKLIRQLLPVLNIFKGPEIPTDIKLSGVIYTRYDKASYVVHQQDYDTGNNEMKAEQISSHELKKRVAWPFSEFANPNATIRETVLQDKYKPMYMLKEDPKGTVRKGLWLKRIYQIKWCIIKEGRQNMATDAYGRDMVDRLRWQDQLHKKLKGLVPLPEIYDFFIENGDAYLIMEYIRGVPLKQKIEEAFQGRIWLYLPFTVKNDLLNYIIQILNIIGTMHTNGFIHRDITTSNFLVNKNQRLCMIDLELSYSQELLQHSRPFRIGTPGFMSPEQDEDILMPTVKQDIYSIGALMLHTLTGFPPDDFAMSDNAIIKDQLNFFIDDSQVIQLIADSLNPDPNLRPDISTMRHIIQQFQKKQPQPTTPQIHLTSSPILKTKIKTLIELALDGLTLPDMINVHKIWVSQGSGEDGSDPYFAKPVSIYKGLIKGVGGPIFVLSRVHKQFSIGQCRQCYEEAVTFIQLQTDTNERIQGGLYYGTAGMAMATVEGIKSGLIIESIDFISQIKSWLQNKNLQGCGIATGLAGQGIALLKAAPLLGETFIRPLLSKLIDELINRQEADGSWNEKIENNKVIKPTGFSHGVAGIACFMLCFLQQFGDEDFVRQSTMKALHWLARQSYKKHDSIRWPIHDRSKHCALEFEDGCMGIILSLIKAYEVFGDAQFRKLANGCLPNYPFHKLYYAKSLASGMAGQGEVFLQGANSFGGEWQERADWIARFLTHYHKRDKAGAIYWASDGSVYSTADLFSGNTGVIHFLLRYYQAEKLSHPLLPC